MAMEYGVDGVIASALETASIKSKTNGKIMVVTPAIRPYGDSLDDQKRTTTPSEAIAAGADCNSSHPSRWFEVARAPAFVVAAR
jgi:orotidine-5'-phosphate decarboxylase